MGYYTQYSLAIFRSPISPEDLSALISSDEGADDALDSTGDSRRYAKWYEHEETLCSWSGLHPGSIFRLHAEGEDSDGIWDKYFVNGKLVHTESFTGLEAPDLDQIFKKQAL